METNKQNRNKLIDTENRGGVLDIWGGVLDIWGYQCNPNKLSQNVYIFKKVAHYFMLEANAYFSTSLA